MLPLIWMHWTLNRRMLFQLSPYWILYMGMVLMGQHAGNTPFLLVACCGCSGLFGGVILLQGLTLGTEDFLLALPVARAQVVRAKYVSALLAIALGLTLPMAICGLAHLVVPQSIPALEREALKLSGLIGLAYAAGVFAFLPFIYAFTLQRGLMVFVGMCCLLLGSWVALKGPEACLDSFLTFCSAILERPRFALMVVTAVALLGLASLGFSTWVYRNNPLSRWFKPGR